MASYSAVGVQKAFWGILDSSGYLMGTTGTVANGSDAGMGSLNGVQSIGIGVPEARAIVIPGDNGSKGTILIPPESAVEGALVTSIEDLTFSTVTQGTTVLTIGNTDTQILGTNCPDYAGSVIIANAPALVQTAGSRGAKGYHAYVYLNNQIQSRGAETLETGSAQSYQHKMVSTFVDRLFTGLAISDSNFGTTDGLIWDLGVTSYPWTAHTFVSNASALTFTVDETPAGASGNYMLIWKNGTALAYTTDYTVVPATKTVTLVAAGTAGDKFEVLYQYVVSC